MWSGQHQLALEVYFDILQAAPERYDLWSRFVQAATGDAEMNAGMQRMLESNIATWQDWPDEFDFRWSMVDALVRLGDDEGAVTLLQELLLQNPRDHMLRRRLADELHRLKRYEEAERIYQELLDEGDLPDSPVRRSQPVQTQPTQTHVISLPRVTPLVDQAR